MQTQKQVQNINSSIKNIELISIDDPRFILNQSKYKKKNKNVDPPKVKPKNETMSYLLEKSIQAWVKSTGKCIEKRVIYYEVHNKKAFYSVCKEVDYLIKVDDKLILGEVKTVTSQNLSPAQALKQLSFSKVLLSNLFSNIELQVIIINLNKRNTFNEFGKFDTNYFNTNFHSAILNNTRYQLLPLEPELIFQYGLDSGVINNPLILHETLEEVDLLVKQREIKQTNSKIKVKIKKPKKNRHLVSEPIHP